MSKIIPDCAEDNKTNYDNQVINLKYFSCSFHYVIGFIYSNNAIFQKTTTILEKIIFDCSLYIIFNSEDLYKIKFFFFNETQYFFL